MKKIERAIGMTLILFGVIQGIIMLTASPLNLSNLGVVSNAYLPFYAGICIICGVLLLYKYKD